MTHDDPTRRAIKGQLTDFGSISGSCSVSVSTTIADRSGSSRRTRNHSAHRMSSHCREPRLKDMLGDSIVKAIMEADGVDPRQLEIELRQITARLRAARRTENSPVGWKARSG